MALSNESSEYQTIQIKSMNKDVLYNPKYATSRPNSAFNRSRGSNNMNNNSGQISSLFQQGGGNNITGINGLTIEPEGNDLNNEASPDQLKIDSFAVELHPVCAWQEGY